jgi:hypothetical protein
MTLKWRIANMKLLTLETAKTAKTEKLGILTGVLFLSPHKESGCMNTCPYADGCQTTCLNTSGRLKFDGAKAARVRRTTWFKNDRPGFLTALRADIEALIRKAVRENKDPAVRLNGLSDLRWEKIDPDLFNDFPEVMFYDYTKDRTRYLEYLGAINSGDMVDANPDWQWFANYHLTFSAGSNTTDGEILEILEQGGTVAMVFHDIPKFYNCGTTCVLIDGDTHDARWKDPPSVIIGLKAKGAAKKSTGQFIR